MMILLLDWRRSISDSSCHTWHLPTFDHSAELTSWRVHYPGQANPGPHEVSVPHCWKQDVDVRWEGPAVYECSISLVPEQAWLIFEGVSYQAEVLVNGQHFVNHEGIWDAFSVSLAAYAGQAVDIQVRVTKNGGSKFPVQDVASGFLPYVFHTFGGIFRPVRIICSELDPLDTGQIPRSEIEVRGRDIYFKGKQFFIRGVLSWGWYPDIGSPNPSKDVYEDEIRKALELGFNLIKFCLWLPPHEMLEAMNQAGMCAWIELPLWLPTADPTCLQSMKDELERIVRQYRHHENILLWTCGCELSQSTPPEYRESLVLMVKELTGNPLVKDNSGGSEMYDGHPAEFGDFDDFHPYCELHHYPLVLESLRSGPRKPVPLLLGEFNDYDDYRALSGLRETAPYWASNEPEINDQGVRWQFDLPRALGQAPLADEKALEELSRDKSRFIRKFVQETVRSNPDINGYVLTGWVDTPISTSGVLDDQWQIKNELGVESWNRESCLFVIPKRRPPWIHGGNRVGFQDSFVHFADEPIHISFGIHTNQQLNEQLFWQLIGADGSVLNGDGLRKLVENLAPQEIGFALIGGLGAGKYELRASFGDWENSWPLTVVDRLKSDELSEFGFLSPDRNWPDFNLNSGRHFLAGSLSQEVIAAIGEGRSGVVILDQGPVISCPFWRECVQVPRSELGAQLMDEGWQMFVHIAPDCVLNFEILKAQFSSDAEWIADLTRVDTRTFIESVYVATMKRGDQTVIFSTIGFVGRHGIQQQSFSHNPAGHRYLRHLMSSL